jgi:hypothetical protein
MHRKHVQFNRTSRNASFRFGKWADFTTDTIAEPRSLLRIDLTSGLFCALGGKGQALCLGIAGISSGSERDDVIRSDQTASVASQPMQLGPAVVIESKSN